MLRRIRRVSLVLLLAAATIGVLGVVSVRPALQEAQQAADRRWRPLREPLTARYAALEQVAEALGQAGAADRQVTRALRDRLGLWELLAVTTDAAGQAAAAADLEGLAARARTTAREVDALAAQEPLAASLRAFDATVPDDRLVARYNRSVLRYERRRRDPLRRVVADLDGYGPRRALELSLP